MTELYKSKKEKFVTGFSLIELLLASAILVVVLSSLLHLFNYCYTLSMQAGNITYATAGAYGKLDEIRAFNYGGIMGQYNGDPFNLTQLKFNGNGTIDIAYVPGTNSELLQVTINIDWVERGNRAMNLSLTSYIAER